MMTELEGILTVEGSETGDGRMIEPNALTWGEGPWPLTFAQDNGGHGGATIGTITEIWRDGSNIRFRAEAHDDSDDEVTSARAKRAVELIKDGAAGISVELDEQTEEVRMDAEKFREMQKLLEGMLSGEMPEPEEKDGQVILGERAYNDELIVITAARIRAAAVVDVPAFPEAEAQAASIAVAAAARPDLAAFQNPNFGRSGDEDERLVWQEPERADETPGWGCPLTITEDGRVYGHAALFGRCHGSHAYQCLTPKMLGTSVSNWLVGDATGTGIPTGPIVLDTTHGVTADNKSKGMDWLANTGKAVADVNAGADSHGIWVAGRLRPGITDRELAALRGSGLSLEWHSLFGKLQIVGCLAVNGPGYRIHRQRAAVAASVGMEIEHTMGAVPCCEGPTLEDRVGLLEAMAWKMIEERIRG